LAASVNFLTHFTGLFLFFSFVRTYFSSLSSVSTYVNSNPGTNMSAFNLLQISFGAKIHAYETNEVIKRDFHLAHLSAILERASNIQMHF
jgi:hypothetical protein